MKPHMSWFFNLSNANLQHDDEKVLDIMEGVASKIGVQSHRFKPTELSLTGVNKKKHKIIRAIWDSLVELED